MQGHYFGRPSLERPWLVAAPTPEADTINRAQLAVA
jgi:hypothetical protein